MIHAVYAMGKPVRLSSGIYVLASQAHQYDKRNRDEDGMLTMSLYEYFGITKLIQKEIIPVVKPPDAALTVGDTITAPPCTLAQGVSAVAVDTRPQTANIVLNEIASDQLFDTAGCLSFGPIEIFFMFSVTSACASPVSACTTH
jgi:hypothetical protein